MKFKPILLSRRQLRRLSDPSDSNARLRSLEARVSELLAANNKYLQRARDAEYALADYMQRNPEIQITGSNDLMTVNLERANEIVS